MEPVRVGVVGLGGWGKNLVRNFSRTKGSTLAMICDADPKTLAAQAALYPSAQPTSDLEALLANPEIDAVAFATPAPTHFKLGMRALHAGKHVYVEKPMTLASADAEALCAEADRGKRTLMVGHLLEYHSAVNWMKDYVASGALGSSYYMYSQRLNLGTVRPDENALWSLAPHDVSVILYLFGAAPDRVAAHGASYLQPGIEDVVFVNLHFPDGRTAQIHISWLDPLKERKMILVGSQTMVVFDDMSAMEPLRVYHKGADVSSMGDGQALVRVRHGDVLIPHLVAGEPLQTECQHFVDCIRDGVAPRSDGRDGLRVVRVLEAADQSLKSGGEPVAIRTEDILL